MKNIRKLKIIRFFWILGLIVSLLLLFSSFMLASLLGILITVIGLTLFVVSIIKIKSTSKKLKKTCKNCGELLLIENCRYEEGARETNTLGDLSVSIKFVAECINCENEKTLTKKYTIYRAPRYKLINDEKKQISHEKTYDIKRKLKKQKKKLLVKNI